MVSNTVTVPPAMYIPPPCPTRKVLTFGQFREVSSAGASEESTRKVPKASAYAAGTVGVDVGARYCHNATIDGHPPTLPNKERACVLGQFREVSSAGGVGRKFQERATYIWSFIVVDVGVRYCHCATTDVHPATLPNKERACIWSVQGSFFRRGA